MLFIRLECSGMKFCFTFSNVDHLIPITPKLINLHNNNSDKGNVVILESVLSL